MLPAAVPRQHPLRAFFTNRLVLWRLRLLVEARTRPCRRRLGVGAAATQTTRLLPLLIYHSQALLRLLLRSAGATLEHCRSNRRRRRPLTRKGLPFAWRDRH